MPLCVSEQYPFLASGLVQTRTSPVFLFNNNPEDAINSYSAPESVRDSAPQPSNRIVKALIRANLILGNLQLDVFSVSEGNANSL